MLQSGFAFCFNETNALNVKKSTTGNLYKAKKCIK